MDKEYGEGIEKKSFKVFSSCLCFFFQRKQRSPSSKLPVYLCEMLRHPPALCTGSDSHDAATACPATATGAGWRAVAG